MVGATVNNWELCIDRCGGFSICCHLVDTSCPDKADNQGDETLGMSGDLIVGYFEIWP